MQFRLIIVGICMFLVVGMMSNQDESTSAPVKEQKVESVNQIDVTDLCSKEDSTELRYKTIFESEVWCYRV